MSLKQVKKMTLREFCEEFDPCPPAVRWAKRTKCKIMGPILLKLQNEEWLDWLAIEILNMAKTVSANSKRWFGRRNEQCVD